MEAWILRRLVYIFARISKRGHRPREYNLRLLMEASGIPIPEARTSRHLVSLGHINYHKIRACYSTTSRVTQICTSSFSKITPHALGESLEEDEDQPADAEGTPADDEAEDGAELTEAELQDPEEDQDLAPDDIED